MSGTDRTHGYDEAADQFIALRSDSGQRVVAAWAASLPPGATIIDVGCGHGDPLTGTLVKAGLTVWALDASPKLVAAFEQRYPAVPIVCEDVQTTTFFDRTFDAVLAVGLIFLFPPDQQAAVLNRFSTALAPDGRLLFSAPWQEGRWDDLITGKVSHALGKDEYHRLLREAGLTPVREYTDDGGTHYYEAVKAENGLR